MTAQSNQTKLIFTLALAGFASAASWRIADPITGLLAGDFQRAAAEIAIFTSAFAIGYAASQPLFGPLADSYGKARIITGLAAALAGSLLLSMFASSYSAMMACRLFSGFCAGSIIPVSMALIGDRVPMAGRQVALSRFIMVVSVGQVAGAAATGLIADRFGWPSVFALGAVIAAGAAVAMAALVQDEPAAADRPDIRNIRANYREVFARPLTKPLAVLFAVEGMLVHAIFPYVAPLLSARGSGIQATEPGLVIGAFALGISAYTLLVSQFLKWLGPARMMQAGGVLMAASLLIFMLPKPWQFDLITMFVYGAAFYLLHNSLQTLSTEAAPGMRATASSVFAAAYFGGQALGPLIIAALFGSAGIGWVCVFAAAGLLAAGLIAPAMLAKLAPEDQRAR